MLLIAVFVGERMGNRVIGQATGAALESTPAVSPAAATAAPYGPDWKRSQALSAAGDPHFPDPRVPPQPLPTPLPAPTHSPTPLLTPTPNPNIPIWRQKPFPTFRPSARPEQESPSAASAEPSAGASAPP